jgi:transposase
VLLKDFRGILQTDAYVAYKAVTTPSGDAEATDDGVVLVHSWAHCRRRFFEIAHKRPGPIAREALQRIADLYAIEAEIRGRSAEERRAARQSRSKPLLDAMRLWLEQRRAELSRKSPWPKRSATR